MPLSILPPSVGKAADFALAVECLGLCFQKKKKQRSNRLEGISGGRPERFLFS